MNAIAHSQHVASQHHDFVERACRAVLRALPAVLSVLVFAAIFVVALAVRFVDLARTNPEVAATLHRLAQALGLGS